MVSDAQKRAKVNFIKDHPLQQTYWNRKSAVRSFINVELHGSKPTKLAQAINENRIQYINDLKEFKQDIEQRLKDLQQ
ncbi:hypothetical protein DKZ29_08155 [Limosilactobacillus reuteri]|uniref:hypothetical protein n=1 Tax=Limosilactobacillus reuteri TaxID=1598 RepID=UPI000D6F9DDB|nr:hypothetical protein [Limosilactobacillus reuteri]MCC4508617.1 hypothetical protein [Limosilactobacillus reuteri]MCR1877948.1 hypothetical protein [Limosilactobacillus reuteri]PWT35126.1 hypothetical protein DKZ24_05320 [Limosilactobacillus reuteri]PWT57625.1 hypothetical protein DKZ29_08155 [Limosilactobacillus reuteri]PWT59930.1 hypothetical protein DKZ30_04605 [Limosilactobacillus reuteri]